MVSIVYNSWNPYLPNKRKVEFQFFHVWKTIKYIASNNVHTTLSAFLEKSGNNFTIYNADAGEIKFITNDTERLRIQSGGGRSFNGDTAAANALDDYEEGTWTPVGGSFTVSAVNLAQYTKIGQQVTVLCYINGTSGTSGAASISGLPFTPSTATANHKFGNFAIASGMASMPQTNTWVMPHVNAKLYLRYQNTTGEGDLSNNNFSNTSNFGWTATYKV